MYARRRCYCKFWEYPKATIPNIIICYFNYHCTIFDNEMSFGERVDTFKKEYAEQELCDHRFYPYTKTKDDLKSYVEDLAKLCLSTKNNVKLSSDILKNIDIAKAESEL